MQDYIPLDEGLTKDAASPTGQTAFGDVNIGKKKQAWRSVVSDPMAFTTSLSAIAGQLYGKDYLSWTAEAILLELQDDLDIAIPPQNIDKIMAGQVLITTNRFYRSVPDFIDLVNVLSNTTLNMEMFDPADAQECAWGVVEAKILWPTSIREFDPQIIGYIEKALENEGIIRSPKVLSRLVPSYKLDVDQSLFDEDPELYTSVYQTQQSKTDEIDQAVTGALRRLATELDSLQIFPTPGEELLLALLRSNGE